MTPIGVLMVWVPDITSFKLKPKCMSQSSVISHASLELRICFLPFALKSLTMLSHSAIVPKSIGTESVSRKSSA